MKCECGTETKIKDSRRTPDSVWRKRFCPSCDAEFTTVEQRCETLRITRPKTAATKPQADVVRPPAPAMPRPKRQPMADVVEKQLKEEGRAVDRRTPTARDRIEDMKFERAQSDYGWGV